MEKSCKVKGCKRAYRAKGYCGAHYKKWRDGKLPKPRYKICTHENCRKPMMAKGLCKEHFEALIKAKAPQQPQVAQPTQQAATPQTTPQPEPQKEQPKTDEPQNQ